MIQYVEKSALVAEIDKRMLRYEQERKTEPAYYDGLYTALKDLKDDFIDTLETKHIDLDKEYKDFIKSDNGRSMYETAKHFFELGLRSTITEEDCKLIWTIGDDIPYMAEEEFYKELLKRFKQNKEEDV